MGVPVWLLDTTGWGGPALIVCPDEETGLTPAQLREIDDWLPQPAR